MLRTYLRGWAAWAPGLDTAALWQAWAERPQPITGAGTPDVSFLDPMLRRRCDPLTRMLLFAAHRACVAAEAGPIRSVFASRHGSVIQTAEILDGLIAGQPVSPTRFGHSVHNAPAGLFSIATGNRAASTSLAAGPDTFASGFLEAVAMLARPPRTPVLLVAGDAPLPTVFEGFADSPELPHAVALLLAAEPPGRLLEFDLAAGGPAAEEVWPPALAFLRALLAGRDELRLGSGRARFVWRFPAPDLSARSSA